MNLSAVVLPGRRARRTALAITILGATAFAQDGKSPAAKPQGEAKAEPVFADGEAQVVPAFDDAKEWVHDELWVEAEFDSDGDGKKDLLHVDVTRQRQTDSEGLKVPVVYESSPYFAGVAGQGDSVNWDPHQELGAKPVMHEHPKDIRFQKNSVISRGLTREWIPRGFAVVHSDAPGTGQSQGCPTVGGPAEWLAPKAVIDWLNHRAKGYTSPTGGKEIEAYWCTGKVGMTGTSYNGTLALAAATTGVEGLEAIIPVSPNTSYYHYYRSNGLVRHPGGYMGEDMDVLYDFVNSGDPARRKDCDCHVRDEDLLAHIDRKSGDENAFWEGRELWNRLDKVHAATLFAHGLNDWNVMPEHSVHCFEVLKKRGVPVELYLHQGGHGGPPPMKMMNRWFTRWLYDVRNEVEDDPLCWVVREDAKRGDPTPYQDYPNPDAAVATLRPGKGGGGVGPLTAVAKGADAKEKLVDDAAVPGAEMAQAESSKNRLLYATAPLAEELHLSGTPRVHLRLACSKPATNLSVWLVELPWTGSRNPNDDLINRGWADPQNRNSLTKSEPLVPGQFVDVAFDLQPDDQVIPKGKKIGLMIFASDHDFTLWPKPGTELTIDLAGTSLELPVVGGEAALQKATAVAGG